MYDIYLKDITLIKNERKILSDINVHFPKGKTTVVIGPSGCGKSTLLKVAAGLIPVDSGRVLVGEADLSKLKGTDLLEFRRNSGFVFQDAALWANKSVYQNMALPLQLHYPELKTDALDRKIRELLRLVGYTDSIHLRPAALSNGEQKMVSLARALVTDPGLLYVDNPLVLVDPTVLIKMSRLISDIHETESTIIANFSAPELVERMADYLIVMKDGMIVESGEYSRVRHSGNSATAEIVESLLQHNRNNI